MRRQVSTYATKKLLINFVRESLDYRKRSLYLQEIISMGKENNVWRQALLAFLDTPYSFSRRAFSEN